MGWQTLEALKERKLVSWLRKGTITKEQFFKICSMCEDKGFWEALGYATKCKYKTHPELKKRYEYKWINIPKKECKLFDYVTTGRGLSNQKRHRMWRNIFFKLDDSDRLTEVRRLYPNWEVFFMKHNHYRIGLRKEI